MFIVVCNTQLCEAELLSENLNPTKAVGHTSTATGPKSVAALAAEPPREGERPAATYLGPAATYSGPAKVDA